MERLDNDKVLVNHRIFTWSNVLSFSRVIFAGLVVYEHQKSGITFLFNAYCVWIVLSDYLDGWAARKTNNVSELGKFLDPSADKAAAIILFVYSGVAGLIPWWFIVFASVRDVIIGIGGTLVRWKRGKALMAVWSGKVGINVVTIYWLAAFYFPNETNLLLFLQGASFMMLLYAFHEYILRSWKAWNGADYN